MNQTELILSYSNKVSYMNNTKWRKFFNAIKVDGECCFPAEIKLLARDGTYPFNTDPGVHESGKCTKDSAIQSPILFKDIEWIFVPAIREIERHNRDEKLNSNFVEYNILALKELIDREGKFEYDFDETGLKIYGYK